MNGGELKIVREFDCARGCSRVDPMIRQRLGLVLATLGVAALTWTVLNTQRVKWQQHLGLKLRSSAQPGRKHVLPPTRPIDDELTRLLETVATGNMASVTFLHVHDCASGTELD